MSATKPDDGMTARQFKALAHPARLELLRAIAQQDDCCCGDLACCLPLAQSTISQHLKVLKEAGLITLRSRGTRSCYRIEQTQWQALRDRFDGLTRGLLETRKTDAS